MGKIEFNKIEFNNSNELDFETYNILEYFISMGEKETMLEKAAKIVKCTEKGLNDFINIFKEFCKNAARDGVDDIDINDLDFCIDEKQHDIDTLYKHLFDLFNTVCLDYVNKQDDIYRYAEFNFNYLLDGSNSKLDDGGAYNIEMSPEEVYQKYKRINGI